MKETPSLKLKLPDPTDYILISDINGNMEIIDGEVKKINEDITKISDPETGVEAKLTEHKDDIAVHKTSQQIRGESTTELRSEVVSSLPMSNLNKGRIIFLDSANEPSFKGYDGGKWV